MKFTADKNTHLLGSTPTYRMDSFWLSTEGERSKLCVERRAGLTLTAGDKAKLFLDRFESLKESRFVEHGLSAGAQYQMPHNIHHRFHCCAVKNCRADRLKEKCCNFSSGLFSGLANRLLELGLIWMQLAAIAVYREYKFAQRHIAAPKNIVDLQSQARRPRS